MDPVRHTDGCLLATDLQRLLDALMGAGYRVIGPCRTELGVDYLPLTDATALPAGWTDRQGPGSYRVAARQDGAVFGYHLGTRSWKHYLFPPDRVLMRTTIRPRETLQMESVADDDAPPMALLGVRACELAAIAVQDRVLTGGAFVDADYARRRARCLIIGVNCNSAADTCFCASMGTGPELPPTTDLTLTEITTPGPHRFLVAAHSARGEAILADLPTQPVTPADREAAEAAMAPARDQRRQMPAPDTHALLREQVDSPVWSEVAERCLSCANCTMACPTCFCHTVTDDLSLDGATATRSRHWDSCFGQAFSYIHGGSVRVGTASRYRHWLTHKLSTWQDQFGELGCVGCGRCITWCPVGIDLTDVVGSLAEAAASTTAEETRHEAG